MAKEESPEENADVEETPPDSKAQVETGDANAEKHPDEASEEPRDDEEPRDNPPETPADRVERDDAPKAASLDGPAAQAEAAASTPLKYAELHEKAGLLGFGAFLLQLLVTMAWALAGQDAFDAFVGTLERAWILPTFELFLIFVPLAFYTGYGVHLLRSQGFQVANDAPSGTRYLGHLRRAAPLLAVLFVIAHFWAIRAQRTFFGLSDRALLTALEAHLSSIWAGVPWIALLYILGILATVSHLADGIARELARRHRAKTTDPKGPRALALGLGLALFAAGAAAVIGLTTGTSLLRGADGDSAHPKAACGEAASQPAPLFERPSSSSSR